MVKGRGMGSLCRRGVVGSAMDETGRVQGPLSGRKGSSGSPAKGCEVFLNVRIQVNKHGRSMLGQS